MASDVGDSPVKRHVTAGLALTLLVLVMFPHGAFAQSVNIDLGSGGQAGATGRLMQLTALLTVLSLAPSLLVMVTAFTRIIIVLSLLRSAVGAQGTPPNSVLIGLALFLTYFVMQPVLDQAWTQGVVPLTFANDCYLQCTISCCVRPRLSLADDLIGHVGFSGRCLFYAR